MVRPNAFIVESDAGVALIDTTLTMSDSMALKKTIDNIGKPLLGIMLTHGHPDHVAGTANIAPNGDVPIYALQSVNDLMRASEAQKHAQWSGMFKEEWVPKWVYPNHIVKHGETIKLADLEFTVVEIGAGGDCDANSLWLLENSKQAAFLGDFIYNEYHTFMMDGSILRWLGNLRRVEKKLREYERLYVGHGSSGDVTLIAKQIEYILEVAALALEITDGAAVFTDETRKQYADALVKKYPGYGFQMTIPLSADALARELEGVKNYNW